jgi:hypothetical protein
MKATRADGVAYHLDMTCWMFLAAGTLAMSAAPLLLRRRTLRKVDCGRRLAARRVEISCGERRRERASAEGTKLWTVIGAHWSVRRLGRRVAGP